MTEPIVGTSLIAAMQSYFEAPAVALNYHLVVAAVGNCFVEVISVAGNFPAAVAAVAADWKQTDF
jgi:hypothetical protein